MNSTSNELLPPYRLLERDWAKFNVVDPLNVVACSSGTAALHLALESLQLPMKSLVAVPDYTMISCARAVTLAGLELVFIGCSEKDLLMDLDTLDDALSTYPIRAVMAVHIHGRTIPMDELSALALKHGVHVIEDSSEVHGVFPHDLSDAVCWSFYRNKVISGEEGGAVFFSSEKRAALARQLRCVGFTDAHDYDHIPRGHNYRLANLLALPILASLENYPNNLPKRRRIESWYDLECPHAWKMPSRDVPWVYDLRIPGMKKDIQDRLISSLRGAGVEARHGFRPMSSQAEYRQTKCLGRFNLARASEIFSLPLDPSILPRDVSRAFSLIHSIFPFLLPNSLP